MKDIKGYEGLYAIDESGNVWGYKRKHFLKPVVNADGYYVVSLYKEGKSKIKRINRLVAETFIPNPNGYPVVNHKNENKNDNTMDNLEWCTVEYNNKYGTRLKRISKPVYCVELDKVYESSVLAAKELGILRQGINCCCKGIQKTTGGYHFRYAEV